MKKAAEAAFSRCRDVTSRGRRGGRLLSVALAELLDATRCIDDLLLAGVERMARRADFNVQRLVDRRARLERDAAAAGHVNFAVLGMDVGFHSLPFVVRMLRNHSSESPQP